MNISSLKCVLIVIFIITFKNESISQTISQRFQEAKASASIPSSYEINLTTFASHTLFQAGSSNGNSYGPIKVAAPRDGSNRIFVSSQFGSILVFDALGNSQGTFLNLTNISASTGFINGGGAAAFRGLMYFDFHPDYAIEGKPGYRKLYVGYQVSSSYDSGGANANYRIQNYHNRSGSNQYAIAEFTVSASNPNVVDQSSFREVFRVQTEGSNPHGIGEIAFNSNSTEGDADYGLLYIAMGDGSAAGNDPPASGYIQNLNNPFGKILCIDPIQNGSETYSTPSTNPYYGQVGVSQEIYAIGFRDPQTFSFSHDTDGNNILIVFDIGAGEREEVMIVRAGNNYGWERFEGTRSNNSGVPLVSGTTHSPPVIEYDHTTGGFAIAGGFLVSDPQDQNFKDKVIFTDLPTGKVFYADYAEMLQAEKDGTQADFYEINNFRVDGVKITENVGGGGTNPGVTFEDVVRISRGDLRFGYDEQNNVYFITKQSGKVFKTEFIYQRKSSSTVSVDEIDTASEVIFYPNPSNEVLFVKLPSNKNNEDYNLTIYNSLGSNVLNRKGVVQSSSTNSIDVSSFKVGTYYVKLILDRGVHYKKIIIQ